MPNHADKTLSILCDLTALVVDLLQEGDPEELELVPDCLAEADLLLLTLEDAFPCDPHCTCPACMAEFIDRTRGD